MGSDWLLAALAMMPGLAAAAGSPFDAALGAVTEREWLGIVVLSGFGGLASLLQRLDASQQAIVARAEGKPYAEKSIIRSSKPLFVAAHMAGAIFTGVMVYFILAGQSYVSSGPAVIALILAVAFGGAQAAERSAAAYFRILRLLRESEPGDKK